jgi:penicillin-binding protein 2
MFQRRLKAFLFFLLLASGLLTLRAAQIQLIQRNYWRQRATELRKRWEPVETTRGAIRDRLGRILAYDAPCIDACVDYRAIVEDPDPQWLRASAERILVHQLGDPGKDVKSSHWQDLLDAQTQKCRDDLSAMWAELARVSGKSPEEIDEIRQSIIARVEMRKRYIWWRNYEQASVHPQGGSAKWYQNFLGDSGGDEDVDKYWVDVAEETEPHVILTAIDPQTQADLARQQDRFFALTLLPSKHREYPFGRTGCHLLGHLTQVTAEQMGPNDPFGDDELKRYWPNDQVGAGGIEELCEKTLRGSRGRIEKLAGEDQTLDSIDPIGGKDVNLSIDIELQSDIEQAFIKKREFPAGDNSTEERFDQHGAAVVLDIATNQVLAMVSNPGFDPNTLDKDYVALSRDDLNLPLMNRATQMALEPGSTVKTIVGCGSITHGFMTPTSTIECTGYLVLHGVKYHVGRCWVAGLYEAGKIPSPLHHPVPLDAPHPTGFLTVSDGLERSCNVVFETIADKMGMRELSYWFDQFGLGRPTGIGIDESSGLIPDPVDAGPHSLMQMWTWFAGIGQGRVHATPLQMADVAATIARNGIWMRPQLVAEEDVGRPTTRPLGPPTPDVVDLHLAPEAVAAVREGMRRVCNTTAGTGLGIRPDHQEPPEENDPLEGIVIAGKTGSAQTSMMSIPKRDADGNIVMENGREVRVPVELGSPGTEGWYAGVGPNKHMVHAWFIGYAPADHPKVAFCVLVEYGEAGGPVAGSIAHDVLEACVRHGYLSSK